MSRWREDVDQLCDPGEFAIVWARTGPQSSGARGISAFLVPLNLPGIKTSEFDDFGGRCAAAGRSISTGSRYPQTHLIGRENEGFVQVMQGFDYSRALIGLQCLAVADSLWTKRGSPPPSGRALANRSSRIRGCRSRWRRQRLKSRHVACCA